jgi:uncharacterized protein
VAKTLKELLTEFKKVDGVDLAAIVGSDGLVIESIAKSGVDVDAIGALADNGLAMARALGMQIQKGEPVQTLLEYTHGILVMESLSEDAMIVISSEQVSDLGRVRFLTRHHRHELIEALNAI